MGYHSVSIHLSPGEKNVTILIQPFSVNTNIWQSVTFGVRFPEQC